MPGCPIVEVGPNVLQIAIAAIAMVSTVLATYHYAVVKTIASNGDH